MKKPRFKLLSPHVKDCGALEHVKQGWWSNPWHLTGDHEFNRDILGRKRGSKHWMKVICNSTRCTGSGIVLVQDICDLFPKE